MKQRGRLVDWWAYNRNAFLRNDKFMPGGFSVLLMQECKPGTSTIIEVKGEQRPDDQVCTFTPATSEDAREVNMLDISYWAMAHGEGRAFTVPMTYLMATDDGWYAVESPA